MVAIICTLSRCSQPLVSNRNRNIKQAIVPGWNAHVKEQHDYARDAYYWLWREMGKPRNGDIFTLMKLSRSRLKYALRKCKREQEVIGSDSISNRMCQKESRNFRKKIRCTMNNKVKLPTSVDGVCGDANIASMWKSHYDNIFNSVHDSHCDKVYNDIIYVIRTLLLTMK